MSLLDARPYSSAVKAAIKAQIGVNEAYDYGRVPGSDGNPGNLPNIFVLVSIERRNTPGLRLSAQAGRTAWRIGIRGVGRTVDEARWAMFRVAVALNENRIVVNGEPSTPIQFESDEAPQFDDGRFSASALYVFTA